jgi:hypothetical protein
MNGFRISGEEQAWAEWHGGVECSVLDCDREAVGIDIRIDPDLTYGPAILADAVCSQHSGNRAGVTSIRFPSATAEPARAHRHSTERLWDRKCLCESPTYDTQWEDYTADDTGYEMRQQCTVCGTRWHVEYACTSVRELTGREVNLRTVEHDFGFACWLLESNGGLSLGWPTEKIIRGKGLSQERKAEHCPLLTYTGPIPALALTQLSNEGVGEDEVWWISNVNGDVFAIRSIDIEEVPAT